MLLAMCHRCALCRSVRREVAPLPCTEASLFRTKGREGRKKKKTKRVVADAIGKRLLFLQRANTGITCPVSSLQGVCLKGLGRVSAILV